MSETGSFILTERKSAFIQLGVVCTALGQNGSWPGHGCGLTEAEYGAFNSVIARAHVHNGWFTETEVRYALSSMAAMLDARALDAWLAQYPRLVQPREPRKVGIIMAGNVPFVGFSDLMCVLLCGHQAVVKPASDDAGLTPGLLAVLACLSPELAANVEVRPGKLGAVDALIATGSNNTARYFGHYFANLPHIFRKGRTSVAVLDGSESAAELDALGSDVFRYFGLGCRNVGKVFIPQDFPLDRLFEAFFRWKNIIQHHKYANNYDYNRAVWMLDRVPITENGFLVMKEDRAMNSPVAALYYERYTDSAAVGRRLKDEADQLQCIVGHGHLPFGTAQCPGPQDYADGVDTVNFLLDLP